MGWVARVRVGGNLSASIRHSIFSLRQLDRPPPSPSPPLCGGRGTRTLAPRLASQGPGMRENCRPALPRHHFLKTPGPMPEGRGRGRREAETPAINLTSATRRPAKRPAKLVLGKKPRIEA
jgi:hypothetical protein